MTSPLLALFVRSLREDSRLKFTYFSRAALVLVLLFFLYVTHSSFGWSNAPGLQFFGTVLGVDLCAVVLAGVSYFASAISEEKEEMTLGLLRMTNLNPLSILLGKSTSRLCTALLLFVVQIPFTLLAITLGGISLHQISAAYLAVGSFLFFVGNLALFFSVIARRAGSAAVFTGGALFFFFMVVPLANWFAKVPIRLGLLEGPNAWTQALDSFAGFARAASPFMRMNKILSTNFQESGLTLQVWSNLALGIGFFLLAWLVFDKFCSEQKETAPGRLGVARPRGRWRALSPGRAWSRAPAWKDFYFAAGGKAWILIKLAIYGTPLAAIFFWPEKLGGPPEWENFGLGTFWFMAAAIFAELAFAASSIFRNEHQGQTLSSLAMLPQGIRRVAYAKLFGILPSLCSAGIYLCLSLPLVADPFRRAWKDIDWSRDFNQYFWLLFSFAQGVFFLHMVALLSLYVKRGALPLAIGIHIILFFFTSAASSIMFHFSSDFGLFLVLMGTLVAAVCMHFLIGHRLEALAAEE